MLTKEGGVDIEEVAASTPEKLARLHVDPLVGFQPFQARWLCYTAGIDDPAEQKQVAAIVAPLYRGFVESEAMLCEINPLDRHARGRGEGARRQGDDRRQRPLPPSRSRRAPRVTRARYRRRSGWPGSEGSRT